MLLVCIWSIIGGDDEQFNYLNFELDGKQYGGGI